MERVIYSRNGIPVVVNGHNILGFILDLVLGLMLKVTLVGGLGVGVLCLLLVTSNSAYLEQLNRVLNRHGMT